MTSTLMMILFFLIVAYTPVLLIGYPPGSDLRGVSGRRGARIFDPIFLAFADVEAPLAAQDIEERIVQPHDPRRRRA